jgi:hypothetical protein
MFVSLEIACVGVGIHTLLIQNGHAGNVLLDEHVDNVHDGRVHCCCRKIGICTNVWQLYERLPQLLCLLDVYSNKLQYAVLCYDADNHGPTRLIVAVNNGNTPRPRFEHFATCFVDGAVGMDGDGFYWLDSKRLFDFWSPSFLGSQMRGGSPTSKAVQAELVYSLQHVGVLPVILNDVDVVRGGKQSSKGGRLGVPQWRGDDACVAWLVSVAYGHGCAHHFD